MGKYDRLIDIYESWDLDSLVQEAYYLSCAVRDDIARNYSVNDPLVAAMMVGAYFVDADRFADGDEDELFRRLFKGAPIEESASAWLRDYRKYNWEPWVLNYLRNCSHSELENALRFGIVICSADGYVNDLEKERILRWS